MERRVVRFLVWFALGVPLVMVAVYASLIRLQNTLPPDVFTVPFVASFMVLMTGLLGVSLLVRVGPVIRSALRAGAAAGLIVLGVLAAFSIGLPILVAGLIAAAAFGLSIDGSRVPASLLAGALSAALCAFVLLLGIDVANRVIVCPSAGTEGGSGNGILLGSYQYQCVGGQLVWSTPAP